MRASAEEKKQMASTNCDTPNDNRGHVHISKNALVRTWLTIFSAKGTRRSDLFRAQHHIYWDLFTWVMAAEFPREEISVITNMGATLVEPEGIRSRVPVTIVDTIRAGMRPALLCHEILLESGVIDESLVHEHHVIASRMTDSEGRVIGVDVDFSKADEPVKPESILIIPDPMLATGKTLSAIIARYHNDYPGMINKVIVVSMIAHQSGIDTILSHHPETHIFVGRIDPTLTEKGYIKPGAGGVGERMTGTKK